MLPLILSTQLFTDAKMTHGIDLFRSKSVPSQTPRLIKSTHGYRKHGQDPKEAPFCTTRGVGSFD